VNLFKQATFFFPDKLRLSQVFFPSPYKLVKNQGKLEFP
jgi:hypothetical protein